MSSQSPRRRRYQAAFIDLSGTLHVGNDVIEGAIEACRQLVQAGIKVKYVTNTTKVSSNELYQQLRGMGFDEEVLPSKDWILTTATATKQYLKANNFHPLCLVEDSLLEDLDGISFENPNSVLVGLAPDKFCYTKLNEAFRILSNYKEHSNHPQPSASPLIAMHRSLYYKDSDYQLSLGPGGFVKLLEETTGIEAHIIGKPSKAYFDAALGSLQVSAESTVMIGDDVIGDIDGALRANLGGAILVKTGKYKAGDETKLSKGVAEQSTFVVADSIVEAVAYILDNNNHIEDESR